MGGPISSFKNAYKAMLGSSESAQTPLYIPIKTQIPIGEPNPTSPPSAKVAHALSPIQQHVAAQREAYERERKILLKKASNFGGESAERLIGDYLAI